MKAPGFSLPDTRGKMVKLSDYKGKLVVMPFFATWCPPCRKEMPTIQKLYEELKSNKKIAIIAVGIDRGGKDKIISFAKENGLTFKILVDEDNKVANSYGVSNIPTVFIIDKKGRIIEKVVGSRDWSDKETVDKIKAFAGR